MPKCYRLLYLNYFSYLKCEFAVREGQLPPAHAHRAEPHPVLLGGAAAEAAAGRGGPNQAGEVPGRGRVRGVRRRSRCFGFVWL